VDHYILCTCILFNKLIIAYHYTQESKLISQVWLTSLATRLLGHMCITLANTEKFSLKAYHCKMNKFLVSIALSLTWFRSLSVCLSFSTYTFIPKNEKSPTPTQKLEAHILWHTHTFMYIYICRKNPKGSAEFYFNHCITMSPMNLSDILQPGRNLE
jgi:hypothetical protein